MRGRSSKLAVGNGFQPWGRKDLDRQIRQVVCQENPLRLGKW